MEEQYTQELAKERELLDAIARAFTARADFGKAKRIDSTRLIRIARDHGYKGIDKEARNALKARVGFDSMYKVVTADLRNLFHFPNGFFDD